MTQALNPALTPLRSEAHFSSFPPLCAFASLADVAKGEMGRKSALRELSVFTVAGYSPGG
jgi:hypothetical protein